MKVIYKYPLDLKPVSEIAMPKDARVLCMQTQHNRPCVWAIVDPEEKATETRTFLTFATGHPQEMVPGRYLGTFQLHDGGFVGHVFEFNGKDE